MVCNGKNLGIEVFSTCPQSSQVSQSDYLRQVIKVAQWSEQYAYRGILVYTDNSLVDPWLVTQVILQNTEHLVPLVAVQPIYAHPYAVAKMVSSLAHLYSRRIYLNMVAGGFKNDLTALNDSTPHDKRYDRLIEYTTIIKMLLSMQNSISFEGEFYKVTNLKMMPPLPQQFMPGIFVSGSSEAGLAAARLLGAVAVQYPRPVEKSTGTAAVATANSGIRVGIISRNDETEAWNVAHARFPEDRKGQLTHEVAMKVSDSVWHKQLSKLGEELKQEKSPYWLVPFSNYKTFCPYLVGNHQQVGNELAEWIRIGCRSFILDIPPAEEDLRHISLSFECAVRLSGL
jgi:alkanesulfonate monooxygenase